LEGEGGHLSEKPLFRNQSKIFYRDRTEQRNEKRHTHARRFRHLPTAAIRRLFPAEGTGLEARESKKETKHSLGGHSRKRGDAYSAELLGPTHGAGQRHKRDACGFFWFKNGFPANWGQLGGKES